MFDNQHTQWRSQNRVVAREKKWRRLDSNLCVEWPLRAFRRSLGRLRGFHCTFSSLQASKLAMRELRLLNFLYIYSDT